MIKVKLETGSSLDEFVCSNEKGQSLKLGQNGKGVGPMQAVLMAVAGCSTIDILMILEKMRQKVENISVEVEGDREEDHPRIYKEVNLHYTLIGQIKEKKAEEANKLSLEKYCSVSKMIEKSAAMNFTFDIKEG